MKISSYALFRRLAAGHAYIPNRKHLIPSRSLATSEAYTLYLGTAISILQEHSVILTFFADAVADVQIPGQRCHYTSHSEALTSDCC